MMETVMKFFFFDLDGTLEDSRVDMVSAAQHVRAALGLPQRTFLELVPHVNRGMRELYLNCFSDFISPTGEPADENKLARVQAMYEQRYDNCIAVETKLYPGIRKALEDAKSLGRVAVITNKPEKLSIKLLESLGVLPMIDLVVGGDTCHEAKPSDVPLHFAFQRLGGAPQHDQVFMIGDSQGDSKAGALFGATTVWCAWGYQQLPPAQPSPQIIASTPEDLSSIFRTSLA
ncbi:HAD family hydrolase [bacterium]|nr:HAD family hydrolase [bacterium]